MINNNRIVPVTATDLISLYGLILNVAGTTVTAVDAATDNGQFELTSGSGNLIASEPVATCDFGEGVTSANLYFVPAYDYTGFTIAGAATTPTVPEEGILADGRTLYKAALASGAITITKVGF